MKQELCRYLRRLALAAPIGALAASSSCGGGGGGTPPAQNQAPTAQVSANNVLGNAPLAVQFSAAGSTDPDGSIVSFQWDFDGDSLADFQSSSPLASHMFTLNQTVTVTLTVVDNQGADDTDTVPIIVGAPANTRIVVDPAGNGGDPHISVATVLGRPAAAYESATGQQLSFARALDDTGSSWALSLISGIVGSRLASLAVVDGNPAVAYFSGNPAAIVFERAGTPDGASWDAAAVLVAQGDFGQFPAPPQLVIADGNPALFFEMTDPADSINAPFFIRALDAQGTSWPGSATRVTALGQGGGRSSGAIVAGRPAVAFQSGEAVFMRALDAQGSAWPAIAVGLGETGDVDGDYQLALAGGRPAVLLEGFAGLRLFRAENAEGSRWGPLEVIFAPAQGVASDQKFGSIGGFPAVVFEESNSDQLNLILGNDAAGASFSPPMLVDTANTEGSSVFDIGGRPGLLFYDSAADDLVFRRL